MSEQTLYCAHVSNGLTKEEWNAIPEHQHIVKDDKKQFAITFDAIKQRQKTKNKVRASVLAED